MSAPKHDPTVWIVDRRMVLGTLAVASGISLLPFSGVTAASLLPSHSTPLLADWHIDDQWGPRYAEPISYRGSTARDTVVDGWSAI